MNVKFVSKQNKASYFIHITYIRILSGTDEGKWFWQQLRVIFLFNSLYSKKLRKMNVYFLLFGEYLINRMFGETFDVRRLERNSQC